MFRFSFRKRLAREAGEPVNDELDVHDEADEDIPLEWGSEKVLLHFADEAHHAVNDFYEAIQIAEQEIQQKKDAIASMLPKLEECKKNENEYRAAARTLRDLRLAKS